MNKEGSKMKKYYSPDFKIALNFIDDILSSSGGEVVENIIDDTTFNGDEFF